MCFLGQQWSQDEGVTKELDGIVNLVKPLLKVWRDLVIAEKLFGDDSIF